MHFNLKRGPPSQIHLDLDDHQPSLRQSSSPNDTLFRVSKCPEDVTAALRARTGIVSAAYHSQQATLPRSRGLIDAVFLRTPENASALQSCPCSDTDTPTAFHGSSEIKRGSEIRYRSRGFTSNPLQTVLLISPGCFPSGSIYITYPNGCCADS